MSKSEVMILRNEIKIIKKELDDTTHKLDDTIHKLDEVYKIIAKQNAKLALYESAHMPTSKPSLYNDERRKFRERRGEDPSW